MEGAVHRRLVFAHAYVANGGNATEAAKSAGFSPKTAHVQGSRLLNHVEVQSLVRASAEKLARKYEIDSEMVIRSIAQEMNFDPRRLFHPDGQMKTINEIDEDTVAALQAFQVTEKTIRRGAEQIQIRTIRVKWAVKAEAREQAMKYLGMFKAQHAQRSVLEGVPREVLLALAARLKKQFGVAS